MNRIPGYLVIALLGLVFISAGLVTMFADNGEPPPAGDPAVLALTATWTPTFTPTWTPTLLPSPTVEIPTAEVVAPADGQVVPPTAEVVSVDAQVVQPTVETVPVDGVIPIPTVVPAAEVGVVVPAENLPLPEGLVPIPTAIPTTDIIVPTTDPALLPTMDAGPGRLPTVEVTAGISAMNVPPVTGVPQQADGTVPTVEVPAVQPTVDPALIVPTTDPALVTVPTTDSAILPPVDGVVPIPTALPTSDPVLLTPAGVEGNPAVEVAPTTEVLPTTDPALNVEPTQVLALGQVSGVVNFPNLADHTGIMVLLTLPDGTTRQVITDAAGAFAFTDLLPGEYKVDAGSVGYLTRHADLSLVDGQTFTLPLVSLVMGDVTLDNIIDLADAVLIASNFNGPAAVLEADVNRDGWIDVKDLAMVGADFGQSGPLPWS